MDQDHYMKDMQVPQVNISDYTKHQTLPGELQTVFRSLVSKLNVIAMTSRPDVLYKVKMLTSKYGSATKSELSQAKKISEKIKKESTQMLIPNIGDLNKAVLVAVTDASTRHSGSVFSTGAQVIILLNKDTKAASVVHWQGTKISRVVSSSFAAECLALQSLCKTMYLVRELLRDMLGETVKNIPGLVLTDCHDLYSAIHHLKGCKDYRLLSDVISIRQTIAEDNVFDELRFIHSASNIADSMTKSSASGEALLKILRTGVYDVPGGTQVRDSTLISARTWHQLMAVEGQQGETQWTARHGTSTDIQNEKELGDTHEKTKAVSDN